MLQLRTSSRRHPLRTAWFVGAAMVLPAAAAASLSSMSPPPVPFWTTTTTTLARITTGARAFKGGEGCPSSMARVGDDCVDKYEASLVEIAEDGSESAFSPYTPPNGHPVRAVSRAGVVPQAHISMVEAKHACEASGKRLCRAAEWKAACKGPESTRYPYGDERVPGACVDTGRTAPMSVLYGGEHSVRTMNDPRANQLDGTVEATGAAAECTNGYGVHDMVGNVHEWTDDGSFRGGYYLDTQINGEGCDYRTTVHARTYYDYSTGFRCCADVGAVSEE